MTHTPPSRESANLRGVTRGLVLGVLLAVGFVVMAGLLWALGSALGLGTAGAFFLAACLAPVLVALPVALWIAGLPPKKRAALFGVTLSAKEPESSAGPGE